MASGVACPEISPVKGAAAGAEGPKAGVGNRAFPSAKFRTVCNVGGRGHFTLYNGAPNALLLWHAEVHRGWTSRDFHAAGVK